MGLLMRLWDRAFVGKVIKEAVIVKGLGWKQTVLLVEDAGELKLVIRYSGGRVQYFVLKGSSIPKLLHFLDETEIATSCYKQDSTGYLEPIPVDGCFWHKWLFKAKPQPNEIRLLETVRLLSTRGKVLKECLLEQDPNKISVAISDYNGKAMLEFKETSIVPRSFVLSVQSIPKLRLFLKEVEPIIKEKHEKQT